MSVMDGCNCGQPGDVFDIDVIFKHNLIFQLSMTVIFEHNLVFQSSLSILISYISCQLCI
jgi:hypothetical protein